MKLTENSIVRHHLLEIISFPMPDGSMKTILNSAERLQELGIYDDYKLTIEIPVNEHGKLHGKFMSDDTKKKMSATRKGKPKSEEHKRRISEGLKGHAVTPECIAKRKATINGNYVSGTKGKHWKNVDGKHIYY